MSTFSIQKESKLTISVAQSLLRYEPDTGYLYWLVDRPRGKRAGDRAGRVGQSGYRYIKINQVIYPEHRLIWLIHTGHWPHSEIDHINCDRVDNRWCNLRVASHGQNQANGPAYRNNIVKLKGVSPTYYPPGRFRARIRKNGKEIFLGVFLTAEDAHQAYIDAAKQLHGQFWRVS